MYHHKKLKTDERSSKNWDVKNQSENMLSELYSFKIEDESLLKVPDFFEPEPLFNTGEPDILRLDFQLTQSIFEMKSVYQFSFLEDMMKKTKTQSPSEKKFEEVSRLLEFEKQGNRLVIFPKQFSFGSTPIQNNYKEIDFKQVKKVTLNFKKDKMTEEVLQALCYIWDELEQIEELYIEISNPTISDEEFSILFDHTFWATEKLQAFEINTHTSKVSDEILTHFLGNVVPKMTGLTILNLQISMTKITDGALIAFANKAVPHLNGLQSFGLDLYECPNVTDRGIVTVFEAVGDKFSGLKKMVLNFGGTKISDLSLDAFAERVGCHMTCLSDLHVCLSKVDITDSGALKFCSSLNKTLNYIKEFTLLLNNTKVTDKTVEEFAGNSIPLLTSANKFTFSVYGTEAKDTSVIGLFKGIKVIIKNLNSLILNLGKAEISDESICFLPDEILDTLSNLEQFKVYLHSTSVTDKSVKKLCSKLPTSLKNLNSFALGLCNTSVTNRGAKDIIEYISSAKNLKNSQIHLENSRVTGDTISFLQSIQRR